MNNIFIPDKSKIILRGFHLSSKLLIPLTMSSFFVYNTDTPPFFNLLHIASISNLGFHSYVSTSCIITDYVKPINLSKKCRSLNFALHGISLYGYFKNIY